MAAEPVLLFALLAHSHPESVAEQVSLLRATNPGCHVVLFDGGADPHLFDDVDVDLCDYRWPIRWGWGLERYELGVMLHARDHALAYDLLVVLDSDMVPLRPGFGRWADSWLGAAGYAAAFLRSEPRGTAHRWSHWLQLQGRLWRDVLGPGPYEAVFNPGQLFRRSFVDAVLDGPHAPRLAGELSRSQLVCLEELLWPNLARAAGVATRRFPPQQEAALHGEHTPADVERLAAAQDVFFLHKVPLMTDHPVRRAVRSAVGRAVAAAQERGAQHVPAPSSPSAPERPATATADATDPAQWEMRRTPKVRLVELHLRLQALRWRFGPRPQLADLRLLYTDEARRSARQGFGPHWRRRG